jgi:hypothetical protein
MRIGFERVREKERIIIQPFQHPLSIIQIAIDSSSLIRSDIALTVVQLISSERERLIYSV